MRNTTRQTCENRTITVDFHDEATYFQLFDDGKAFIELVIAFVFALGFQLRHKATCRGGGCLTRHSHYARVRLGVTACNRNGPGLQSARFQAHITCLYPSPPAHINCP
jgi:hypothetical protein